MLMFVNIVKIPQEKGVYFVFYDVYCDLCRREGLTPGGAAAKIGFNRASVTVWKNSGKAPKQELLLKIAAFFGVTADYLLEQTPAQPAPPDEDAIKFALFGTTEIDDEVYEDVKAIARLTAERAAKRKEQGK